MRSIWQQEQIFYADTQNSHMIDAGHQLGKRLSASSASYTALLASNDQLAIGAMGALKEAGIRIPEQMAVTGYDGIDASALPLISLTTAAQPRMKTAEIIIDILRRHAANPDAAAEQHLIKPELIIRNSTSLH
jgi:LacI family transcriptional regulator